MKNFIKLSVFVSLILQASVAYSQWSNGSSKNGIPQITYTGRVSIGGSAVGSYYPTLTLKGRNHNKVLECFDANGNLMLEVNTKSHSPYLKLYDRGSSDIVRVSSSGTSFFNGGNVGIGTSNPKDKLSVNGTIRAKKVRVMTSIDLADYVFAPDYTLRSLAEVEQYVQQHQHLPGVPSAQKVKEEGLEIAEFQNKLLEKIEELTLYAIDQEKRMVTQEQRLQALERENAHLKNLVNDENH